MDASEWNADTRRVDKSLLWEPCGQPEWIDTARLLRWLGLRRYIHPQDAAVFLYASLEAAHAFADLNREVFGYRVHGPYETGSGVISLVDFRALIVSLGETPTDPELPDNLG